jgi:exodeoxyribonuclease-3
MKTLLSWNINGIRSILKKEFLNWAINYQFDVLGVQEIKAHLEVIPEDLNQIPNSTHSSFSAQKKGYSGVMNLYKGIAPISEQKGLTPDEFSAEGRTIISEFEKFFYLNCYFPNGSRDHSRVPFKLRYCDEILKTCLELKKTGKAVIIGGDFNTAHKEIDLKNPKSNKKTTGFLPEERAWHDEFEKAGFVDCFRELHPEQTEAYSWWSYRGDCRERNIGWRIDYFFIDREHFHDVESCEYLPEILGSDHCPVKLTLKF